MKLRVFALFLYVVTTVEATLPTCPSTADGLAPDSDECFQHEVLIIIQDPSNAFPPVLVGVAIEGNEVVAPKIVQSAFNKGCPLLCIYKDRRGRGKSTKIVRTENVKSEALTLLIPEQRLNLLPISLMRSFAREMPAEGKIAQVPSHGSPLPHYFQINRYYDNEEDSGLKPKISINARFLLLEGTSIVYEHETDPNKQNKVLLGLFRKYDAKRKVDVLDVVDQDLVSKVARSKRLV